MNLMEESFQDKEQSKNKKGATIVLIAMALIVIMIIAIIAYLMYIKKNTMKLTLDGALNGKLQDILVFENDGTIYAPIKEIASYFGYESFNGEYTEKSEQPSKCYVINEKEVVNFELGQNRIYKLDLTKNNENYEYAYITKPVKAINGVLYISTEGLEKAFNITFDYNKEENIITIWTLPALYEYYAKQVLDYGYTELSSEFVNQKSILKNQLIVSKGSSRCGVIEVNGTVILEPKYDKITYLPNTGDFLVETGRKVGILSASKEIKVQIIYDSIEVMDIDVGLYVVKKDNRFGVIDTKGNIKINVENDEIGTNISSFSQNNIKNKYLLVGNLIPVRRDKYWALYDKNGNQLVEYKYDSLGYIAANNKDAINLLVIPNYNVLVACKDKKYTLINSSGLELFATVADDIYLEISGGEKHYYITVNNQKIDAEEWLNKNGIKARTTETQEDNESANDYEEQSNDENNYEETDNSENNYDEEQTQEENDYEE